MKKKNDKMMKKNRKEETTVLSNFEMHCMGISLSMTERKKKTKKEFMMET